MSLLATTERLLMKYLPPAAIKPLQQLKAKLPTRLPQGPPVAVMYVNDGEIRSYVGLNNFYSFLLATEATDADAVLRFYSPTGKRVLTHHISLQHFGANVVDVAGLFAQRGVTSPHGIVAVQITPRHPRRVAYRELVIAFSHFFIFFEGNGSVAQVHPLSHIGSHNAPGEPFESSQLVTTRGLAGLEALQYNPGTQPRPVESRLLDATTREVVARSATTIRGLGATRTLFRIADLPRVPDQLLFAADRLPSSNSKPMLRRVFDSGVFTMSHA